MAEHIIEVKGLEHMYGNFKAVDDVSFEIFKGEIFSFLGPNGAGKSTVINILTTLLPMQKGAISMSMETPEGLQAVITLLTLPLFFASNALYPADAFPRL